ncbi:hypothetical protein ACRAWF_47210 [Streptomyces sp. L7]
MSSGRIVRTVPGSSPRGEITAAWARGRRAGHRSRRWTSSGPRPRSAITDFMLPGGVRRGRVHLMS